MNKNIPDILYIETTNTCNANCIFCAYQYDKRPKTTMPFELLSKAVNEYKLAGGKKINFSPFASSISKVIVAFLGLIPIKANASFQFLFILGKASPRICN